MSQSPVDATAPTDEYLDSWNQLSQMIRNGRSFSGRERNCCFLNTGQQRFADVSAATGFDFPDDGRGLALVDWDQDGDLDAWIANRSSPQVRLLMNRMQTDHRWVAFRLEGTQCNRDAIGARVTVITHAKEQRPQIKTLRAGEGFLSQSSKWLHFGLGNDTLKRVIVHWPGAESPEVFEGLESDLRYKVVQGTGHALPLEPRSGVVLPPSELMPTPSQETARIVLLQRHRLEGIQFTDFKLQQKTLVPGNRSPRLINLWASWCQPCIAELAALQERANDLASVQLSVTALCVDRVQDENADPALAQTIVEAWDAIEFGWAETDLLRDLTNVHNDVLYRQRSLPVPCSFLLDEQGAIAAIYRGPLEVDQLLKDVRLLNRSPPELAETAVPFSGMNVARRFSPHGVNVARAYLEGGYLDDARIELEMYVRQHSNATNSNARTDSNRNRLLQAYLLLARIAQQQDRTRDQVNALRQAIQLEPTEFDARIELAFAVLAGEGDRDAANALLSQARLLASDNVDRFVRLGQAYARIGQVQQAIEFFQRATTLEPQKPEPRFNLAIALQLSGQSASAVTQYSQLLETHPGLIEAANNLAWLLATDENPAIRDASRAIELAASVCSTTQNSNPAYLDTLAEAYAAAGNYSEAVQVVAQAIEIALKDENAEMVQKLRQRRQRFQSEINTATERE
ncbi:MAG: hypothetical protein CMJ77_22110 [Planctomycetaceae bacterium]|nr:hypothetical protein [Planctomycetaceae bacterium]